MSVTRIIQPKLHHMSGGMFANWLPNNYVAVGDYGVIRNSRFERLGTLIEYGASFVTAEEPGGRNNLEYTDKVKLSAMAAATASGGGGVLGSASVRLTAVGSFLYHLANSANIRPVNSRKFNEEVTRVLLGDELHFPEDGVIVTEVKYAEKATIIVADGNEAAIEFQTDFEPEGAAFLAGAQGKVAAGNRQGTYIEFVAQDDIMALIRLVRPRILPPGGPAPPMSASDRAIMWFKNLFKERQLDVSELVITQAPSTAAPRMSIQLGLGGEEFLLEMKDVTVEEMVEPHYLDGVMDENGGLKIEEQVFGARSGEATG